MYTDGPDLAGQVMSRTDLGKGPLSYTNTGRNRTQYIDSIHGLNTWHTLTASQPSYVTLG